MSRLDYSKWDKLELSDDDDFECHPNIDKASFIRWRQQDIHQKRQERRAKIEALNAEIAMNAVLQARIDRLVKELQDDQQASLKSTSDLDTWIDRYRKLGLAPNAERQTKDTPPYDDMIAALLLQVQIAARGEKASEISGEDAFKPWLIKELKWHEAKLATRTKEAKEEIDNLKKEEESKLTMENLCHEGFNKTIIKSSDDTKKTSTMEVLNPGYENVNKDKAETSNKKEEKKSKEKEETSNADADDDSDDEQHIKTKEARQFAEINDLGKSFEYMRLHPWLASSDISDEIMAEAFTLELNGDSSKVVQYIRQSKILQYCSELGNGRYFEKFFERLLGPDPRARAVFEDDVAKTHEHIKNRCVVLRKEHEEREARRKELLSKQDPNEAIEIAIPETASENERARAVAFQTFPPPFQHALLSGDLEKVNEVLQTLESDEAERILELCNETGLLSIEETQEDNEDGGEADGEDEENANDNTKEA